MYVNVIRCTCILKLLKIIFQRWLLENAQGISHGNIDHRAKTGLAPVIHVYNVHVFEYSFFFLQRRQNLLLRRQHQKESQRKELTLMMKILEIRQFPWIMEVTQTQEGTQRMNWRGGSHWQHVQCKVNRNAPLH